MKVHVSTTQPIIQNNQQPVATSSMVASNKTKELMMKDSISEGESMEVRQEAPSLHYPPNHCFNERVRIISIPNNISFMCPIYIIATILVMILAIFLSDTTEAVDCFKCVSRNGSNEDCEDPFNNVNTTRITTSNIPEMPPNVMYHTPCYAGRKNREGLFPASACIKIIGNFESTGERLVVRHCAIDSGTLTQDTELARMSHCGRFIFEGETLKGCVLACPEDACNSAMNHSIAWGGKITVLIVTLLMVLLNMR